MVVCMSSDSAESAVRPWWFVSFGPWYNRFTAVLAVLMPVLLVSHLQFGKAGDWSLTMLLAVMAFVWPVQLLRILGPRR